MARKYTLHRENCDCFIRETIIDVLGRTISIGGRHAFEYTITIQFNNTITTKKFPNGREARKEFSKYKRKRLWKGI